MKSTDFLNMSTDFRAALERLISAYDEHGGRWTQTMHDEDPLDDAVERARADLAAEPLDPAGGGEALLAAAPAEGEVGEGPILQWTDNKQPCDECRYDHCTAETPFGRFLISWKSWKRFDSPTVDETPWGDWHKVFDSVDAAKAACQREMDERIAHWGRPPAPAAPADGEVGELGRLVAELEVAAVTVECEGGDHEAAAVRRAATLLQQQAAELAALRTGVVPVAVSERPWVREGWCDEEGRCWFLSLRFLTWSLESPPVALCRRIGRLHSLPFHAIPLPAPQGGEVE